MPRARLRPPPTTTSAWPANNPAATPTTSITPSVGSDTYLHIERDGLRVRATNPANWPLDRDHWSLRCTGPIGWNADGSYTCPATGSYHQESGIVAPPYGWTTLSHVYTTEGSLTITPGSGANRASYTGTTTYIGSSQLNLLGTNYDPFDDPARVGQTWTELLEIEEGSAPTLLSPGDDSVLMDCPGPAEFGPPQEFVTLLPLSQALPPSTGWPPPPIELFLNGEVEVGSTQLGAAVTFGAGLGPPNAWVDELACDGSQTPNPDGSSSYSASGRYAEVFSFPGATPDKTDHYTTTGTLTIWAGTAPAMVIFEGTTSYDHTRAEDGSIHQDPDLTGTSEPRYLQLQDGRATDAPFPFPD